MISVRIIKRFGAKPLRRSFDEAARGDFTLDVEFAAPLGITILFGASGSGKTTTIKSIAGIIRPDSGAISIDGQALFDSERGIDIPIRRRGVGLVFQNLALFPHMTALANVEFPIADLSRRERRRRALELMERLRIKHTAPRRPSEISGGEAQRVALARALARGPKLLLLDEPLSAIDEATKQEIITDLRTINREMRLPVIYVTHNRDEALMLGERLIAYERGRIIAAGEPIEIFGAPVMASLARITGVENIFEGVVAHKDAEAGIMTVEVADQSGSCRLDVPLGKQGRDERILVAVRSGDILLALEEPRSTSARNIMRGHITAIEERGAHTIVRVRSGITWSVSVTRQAAGELGLTVGKQIWLAIKTYSCHLLDGSR